MSRKTVGRLSTELLQKEPEQTDNIEQSREMNKDYVDNVLAALESGKTAFNTDFYVVVETKAERLMPNVQRCYFVHRRSCPTPNYDQIVYRYDKAKDDLSLLWVVPAQDICWSLLSDTVNIDPNERKLLSYVLDYARGDLLKLAKKLNHECADSPLIEI